MEPKDLSVTISVETNESVKKINEVTEAIERLNRAVSELQEESVEIDVAPGTIETHSGLENRESKRRRVEDAKK